MTGTSLYGILDPIELARVIPPLPQGNEGEAGFSVQGPATGGDGVVLLEREPTAQKPTPEKSNKAPDLDVASPPPDLIPKSTAPESVHALAATSNNVTLQNRQNISLANVSPTVSRILSQQRRRRSGLKMETAQQAIGPSPTPSPRRAPQALGPERLRSLADRVQRRPNHPVLKTMAAQDGANDGPRFVLAKKRQPGLAHPTLPQARRLRSMSAMLNA